MKKSKFTEEQIAFALHQSPEGLFDVFQHFLF